MSRCSVSSACGRHGTAQSVVRAVVLERDVWIRLKSMTLPESMLTSGARMSKWNLDGSTVLEMALGLFCQSPMRMKGCVVACSSARSFEIMVALISLCIPSLVRR